MWIFALWRIFLTGHCHIVRISWFLDNFSSVLFDACITLFYVFRKWFFIWNFSTIFCITSLIVRGVLFSLVAFPTKHIILEFLEITLQILRFIRHGGSRRFLSTAWIINLCYVSFRRLWLSLFLKKILKFLQICNRTDTFSIGGWPSIYVTGVSRYHFM